jgi:hypothetical protein
VLGLETLDDHISESWVQILDSGLPDLLAGLLERQTFAVASDTTKPRHSCTEMFAMSR